MSAIGSLFTASAQKDAAAHTNKTNYRMNQENNELNREIAEKNLQLQQNQFEYQQSLNDIQMQREDSAISRMVNDARNAGVSPLANIQGASSSPLVSAPAPQLNMQYQAGHNETPDLSALQGVGEILNNIQQYKSQALDNQRKQIENEYQAKTLSTRVDDAKMENILKRYNALDAREKRYYNDYFHINDNMSEEEKKLRILNTLIKNSKPGNKPTMTGKEQREHLENPDFNFNDYVHFGYFDKDNLQNLQETTDAITGFLSSKVENFFKSQNDSFPENKQKRLEELANKKQLYRGNLTKAEKAEYEKLKKEYLEHQNKQKNKKPDLSKMLWNKFGSYIMGN